MKWEDFLQSTVAKEFDQKHYMLIEEYLYGKLFHDILDCLTSCELLYDFATKSGRVLPQTLEIWFSNNRPIFKNQIERLRSLRDEIEGKDDVDVDELLRKVSKILEKTGIFKVDPFPLSDELFNYVILSINNNLKRLRLICGDIDKSDYNNLLKKDYKAL